MPANDPLASRPKKILFLDILTDDLTTRKKIESEVFDGNTYADCIRRALGVSNTEIKVVDGTSEIPSEISGWRAVVMGGSVEDPVGRSEKHWMKRVYKFIREIAREDVPILGICGGLEFVVRAMGGRIVYNPKGSEFGTAEIELTTEGTEDVLFRGIRRKFRASSSHRCIVSSLLQSWRPLALSKMTAVEALAIGDRIRLLQFHPELSKVHMQGLAKLRRDRLLKEGVIQENRFAQFIDSLPETHRVGHRITRNFMQYIAAQ